MEGIINLTPRDQEQYYLWWKSQKVFSANINVLIAENERKEEEYLATRSKICPLSVIGGIRKNLPQFKPEKLINGSKTQFYDPQIMEAIKCTMDAFFYSPSEDDFRTNITYWLRDLFIIGEESAYGLAMVPTFLSNHPFVIKTSQEKIFDQALFHEFVVGMILNSLRQFLPNFVYTYTFFRCSPPKLIDDENVDTWCSDDGDKNSNYIVLENVSLSTSFTKYISRKDTSFADILDKLLQIMLSLHIANKKIGFTHYDLHTDNVLIRHVKDHNTFQLPYGDDDVYLYIKTDAIATIIDYGSSSIRLPTNNDVIGNWDYADINGTFADKFFPLTDIYKLITNIYIIVKARRPTMLDKILKICKFLSHDPEQLFDNRYGHIAPYTEETKNINYIDFIYYLLSNFPQETGTFLAYQPWKDITIFGCMNNCGKRNYLEEFGFVNFSHHNPLIDMYNDVMSNNLSDKEILSLYPIEKYKKIIDEITTEEENKWKHIEERLPKYERKLPKNFSKFSNIEYTRAYNQLLRHLIRDMRELSHIIHLSAVIDEFYPIYGIQPLDSIVNDIRQNPYLNLIWTKLQNHYEDYEWSEDRLKWWDRIFPFLLFAFQDLHDMIKF